MRWLRRHLSEWTTSDAIFVALEALSFGALLAAVGWTEPWLGVVGLGLGVVAELSRVFISDYMANLDLDVGLTSRIRMALRSALMVAALALDPDTTRAILVAAVGLVLTVQISTGLSRFVLRRSRRPRLIQPLLNLEVDHELMRGRRRRHRWEPLMMPTMAALEAAAMAVAVATLADGEGVATAVLWIGAGLALVACVIAVAATVGKNTPSVRQSYERTVRAALQEVAPEVICYVSTGDTAPYMVGQWLAPLEQATRRCVFVVRELDNALAITDTRWPVIYAPTTRSVELCVLDTTRAALYFANAGRNVHLVRDARLQHAFLNHGDSDKASSANPVARMYDEVWLAGEAARDRYQSAGVALSPEAVRFIGRPQIEDLNPGNLARSTTTVLYAPTFEGLFEEVNYSSVERIGPALVRTLIEQRPEVGIIFRPHPTSGQFRKQIRSSLDEIARLLRTAPNAHLHRYVGKGSTESIYENMNEADVLIGDISSVITDFLATRRPILVSNPKELELGEFESMFPSQRGCYVFDSDMARFLAQLDLALADDPLAAIRLQQEEYLLGVHPEGPTQAFVQTIDAFCADAASVEIGNTFMFSDGSD